MRNPAAVTGTWSAMPTTDAWARWLEPKASLTKMSIASASLAAKTGSFFSSYV